jgi:NADH dehydrogenase
LAEVRAIIPEKNLIQTSIGKVSYDYLVFAAGSTSNFFGNKHIEGVAIPMKNVSEAMGLRNALLSNFERSITCAGEEEKRELLNIVIVGGGATGVEIAGALSEMRKFVLSKDYPEMDKNELQIYLIEAVDRLLPGMDRHSSGNVAKYLRQMGVNILLNQKVTDYRDNNVILADGSRIPTRSFIWVSGITAVPVGNLNPSVLGKGGRIQVDEFNRIKGLENVFAIGDQCIQTSDTRFPNGHPQLAQVAIQQGQLLAKNLNRILAGEKMEAFHYKDLGSMATVGRNKAVAELPGMKLKGTFAWLIWLFVHLRSILGIRNKIIVFLNWLWNYCTYDYTLRLIIYARKAKVIVDRDIRETSTHWGEDVLGKEQ